MKAEVAVWAPVPNKPTVSVDVKQHSAKLVTHVESHWSAESLF